MLTISPDALLFLASFEYAALLRMNTAVVGLIWDDKELVYREEVKQLADWCNTNNLSLNVNKRK